MEIEATRQQITINKLVNTKKEIILIEGDVIVPDVKPDILNTVDTAGNVCVYKKEILDGKVRIDGGINLNVIYLADSDTDFTRGLNSVLDFSQVIEVENCKTGMNLKSNIGIKSIDCKVLNGRKINIKVMLEVELEIYLNEEVSVLKSIDNINEVQTLNNNVRINNLIGYGTCRAVAKDNINILEDDTVEEILKTDVKVINKEMKVSYNKILLKADSNVKIMYLNERNEIRMVSTNIPVMGFIDLNNVSENNILHNSYEMKNILVKVNSAEQHSIYTEIEFEIGCEVNDNMEINLIQDMYSPCNELNFKTKEINTITNKLIIKENYSIKERINVPEIFNNKIYDVEISNNITNISTLNGSLVYEGELNLNFIFSKETTRIDTKRYTLPFSFNIENENINANKIISIDANCINDEFIITSDGMVECKIDLLFEIRMHDNAVLNIIEQMEIADCNNIKIPSMIIYIIKEGDTLWHIAKKYKTTVQKIMSTNNLTDDKLKIGQKLFIPRYSNITIS